MSTDFPSWILSPVSEFSAFVSTVKLLQDFQEWFYAAKKTEEFAVESFSNLELAQLPGAEFYQSKGGEVNESK
ncbi:MAG: hypothetical protein MJK14_17965 [Rivularia sp. ALOHA_DT_140]|nr:hypothetical protein [Rivularia sp. ALOHA_DT_140]